MKKRKFGSTDRQVSELGFGAWQLGNRNSYEWGDSLQDPIRLVHAALDLGVNFFDTAPNYGGGESMKTLGIALEGNRHSAVINTKFGHSPQGTSFAVEDLRPSIEESLRILKTDYLDSVLLHSPGFELCNGSHPLYEEFEKLVEEGKILSYGASLDDSRSIFELIDTSNSSVVMPLYNINFQETGESFEAAGKKNYAVIVKVPLDSGWLTGKYNSESSFSDIRERWSHEIIERRADLQKKLENILGDTMTLHEAALSFILGDPNVSTVIPGIKNESQLESNIRAAEKTMQVELRQKIKEFYNLEISPDPLPW